MRRGAEIPEDVRDAILGHTRQTTGRLYGIRHEALSRLYREWFKMLASEAGRTDPIRYYDKA
jgi:hypothetical protein